MHQIDTEREAGKKAEASNGLCRKMQFQAQLFKNYPPEHAHRHHAGGQIPKYGTIIHLYVGKFKKIGQYYTKGHRYRGRPTLFVRHNAEGNAPKGNSPQNP